MKKKKKKKKKNGFNTPYVESVYVFWSTFDHPVILRQYHGGKVVEGFSKQSLLNILVEQLSYLISSRHLQPVLVIQTRCISLSEIWMYELYTFMVKRKKNTSKYALAE